MHLGVMFHLSHPLEASNILAQTEHDGFTGTVLGLTRLFKSALMRLGISLHTFPCLSSL